MVVLRINMLFPVWYTNLFTEIYNMTSLRHCVIS